MANVIYPTILDALAAIKVSITVEKKEAYSVVHVSAPLYERKEYTLGMVWCHAYTEDEIRVDAALKIAQKYGICRAEGFVIDWYHPSNCRSLQRNSFVEVHTPKNHTNPIGKPMPHLQHLSDRIKTIRDNIELSVGLLASAPTDKKITLVYQDDDKLSVEFLVSLFTVSSIEPFMKEGTDGGYQLVIPLEAAKVEQYQAALPQLPPLP